MEYCQLNYTIHVPREWYVGTTNGAVITRNGLATIVVIDHQNQMWQWSSMRRIRGAQSYSEMRMAFITIVSWKIMMIIMMMMTFDYYNLINDNNVKFKAGDDNNEFHNVSTDDDSGIGSNDDDDDDFK
ncbi:hypothetical protein PV328_011764 [Microctonus aethiopoides]|uniref:Uncharacterized protein n=1 Tax=Microctonus aethiopoides TaxID=144406 RepID=A0AA39C3F0_9HYME|nr:hypothetical protein PV328_011764 [Microctonus aethiopoides]